VEGNLGFRNMINQEYTGLPTKDETFRDDCTEFTLSVYFNTWFPAIITSFFVK